MNLGEGANDEAEVISDFEHLDKPDISRRL